MEYRVVSSVIARDFEYAVSGLLAEGWEPQGGVSVVAAKPREYGDSGWLYTQAMVRKNTTPKEGGDA